MKKYDRIFDKLYWTKRDQWRSICHVQMVGLGVFFDKLLDYAIYVDLNFW